MITGWATGRFTPPFGPFAPGFYPFPGAVFPPLFAPSFGGGNTFLPDHKRAYKATYEYKSTAGAYKTTMTIKEHERVSKGIGSYQTQKAIYDHITAQEATRSAYDHIEVLKDTYGVQKLYMTQWLGVAVRGEKGHDPGVKTGAVSGSKRGGFRGWFWVFLYVTCFYDHKNGVLPNDPGYLGGFPENGAIPPSYYI